MTECDDCVFRLWPVWCHAAQTGHARYCDLIHKLGRKDYAVVVESKTLGTEPKPPAAPSPWLAVVQARRDCPHFIRGCGCDGGSCSREDKAGPTDLARCGECLGVELPGPKH